jgi:hypothetical protein
LVSLNYKEAIKNGFAMKGIQQCIDSKTKIWIEWPCLEYIKKAEEQEKQGWHYHMARDRFAYVGAYRKCIDEIEQLKKELWNIIMDSKVEMHISIQATKELHGLSKTSVLILRELPFVTNLSKFYDKDILNSTYNNSSNSKGTNSNNNEIDTDKNPLERKDMDGSENSDNPFECNIIRDDTKEDNAPKDNNCESHPKHKQVDDDVIETMQAQLKYGDNAVSKGHLESIKRLKELFNN